MSEMIERTSFDTPILPRLPTIIAELQRGVYQIPEFQRPSVWDDDQRLGLMDSIVKGLPIGSLLVWRSSRVILKTYPTVADIPVPPTPSEVDKRTYLIDGHQRISTLFGSLVKPQQPRIGRDARRWPIYYLLGTSESPAFRLPPSRGEVPPDWLPLDILLDNRALFRFRDNLFKLGADEQAEEVERIANVFKDYIIPVVPLVTENLDLVTDAFVRINSKGSDMTEAHMLRALTYLKENIDTGRGFRRIRDALEPLGWADIPDQPLVNSLKAALGLDVYRSSVTELNDELKRQPSALRQLEQALREAVDLLRTWGVLGWGSLPYAYQIVTLAAIAFRDPGSLVRRGATLRSWFWRTTYTEYFTGQTGNQIRRDIDELMETEPGQECTIASSHEVSTLGILKLRMVRTKAFLLFLANRVSDPDARLRRQEALAQGLFAARPGRALTRLFTGPRTTLAGNIVLANATELRLLRKALGNGKLTREQADEYAIPESAIGKVVESLHLIRTRQNELLQAESMFVASLGLRTEVGDPADGDALSLEPHGSGSDDPDSDDEE